ncbi:MAG: YggT family protein [Ktedonobacterales bacterium]
MSPEQASPPEMAPSPAPAYQPARISSVERTCQIVYLVFGIIEVLIVIRILLKLLAANPNAGFTSFMYGVTQPFVAFFQGVFPTTASQNSVFELSSVLAIAVYALLAYVIVRVIRIVSRRQTPEAL